MTGGYTKRKTTPALSLLGLFFQRLSGLLGFSPERLALATAAVGLMAASSGITYWAVIGPRQPPEMLPPDFDLAVPMPAIQPSASQAGATPKKPQSIFSRIYSQTGLHSGGSLKATRAWDPVRKAEVGPGALFKRKPRMPGFAQEKTEPREAKKDGDPPLAVKPFAGYEELTRLESLSPDEVRAISRNNGFRHLQSVEITPMSEARDRPFIPEVDAGRAVDEAPGLTVGKPDLSSGYVHQVPENVPGGMPARMTGDKDGRVDEISLDPNRAYLHEDAAKIKR